MNWLVVFLLSLSGSFERSTAVVTDVEVPNVHLRKAELAKSMVEGPGLVFQILHPDGTQRNFNASTDTGLLVQDQTPGKGEYVSPGSIVSVVLLIPPEPDNVLRIMVVVVFVLIIYLVWRIRCLPRP